VNGTIGATERVVGTTAGPTLRFEGRAMASALSLAVIEDAPARRSLAERAWSAVRDEFEASEAAMSRFRDDSDITRLNNASSRGESMTTDRRLAIALHACDRANRVTDGRFDPRVIDRLEAWGYRGAPLWAAASPTALGAAMRIVERIDRSRVHVPHPIDLGGIGKGLALRWAAGRIERLGLQRYLLDAGGDIVVRGRGPDGDPWHIGIEDPGGGQDPLAVAALRAGAIATSSIRRLRWEVDGRIRHHLVDPATGEPADDGLVAVTVAASDPAWAEVWSKSLFIAGRERIAETARSRGLAAWWVDRDGGVEMTPAARVQTIWVAGEA
jgi:thiamine biosynthesis lipoprotein